MSDRRPGQRLLAMRPRRHSPRHEAARASRRTKRPITDAPTWEAGAPAPRPRVPVAGAHPSPTARQRPVPQRPIIATGKRRFHALIAGPDLDAAPALARRSHTLFPLRARSARARLIGLSRLSGARFCARGARRATRLPFSPAPRSPCATLTARRAPCDPFALLATRPGHRTPRAT